MFKNILAPMDLEASSHAGFKTAVELARNGAGRLTALAVLTGSDVPADLASHDVASRRQAAETQAAQRLDKVVRDMAQGVEVDRVLLFGDPVTEIHALAERLGADVIVITVKNRSRIGKMLMGSKAQEIILGSTRPVLSVPRST